MLFSLLRRFGLAAIIGITVSLSTANAGDYLNPSDRHDCYMWSDRYPFKSRRKNLALQDKECSLREIENNPARKFITSTSCGLYGTYDGCIQYGEQQCDLRRQAENLREACLAKVEKLRAWEKSERERKKAWEKHVREREEQYREELRRQERARRQHEQDTRRQQNDFRRRQQENARRERDRFINNSARRAGGSLFNSNLLYDGAGRARAVQTGGVKIGEGIARGMGVPRPGGAHHLSGAITSIGTRLIQGMQSEAMSQLQSSMDAFNAGDASTYRGSTSRYSRSNPRPTYAQRQHAQYLGEQLQDHAERISQQTYRTPLGEHSAVVGAYTNTVTQLIQARADGQISEGLANVGIVAATALTIKQIYDDVKRKKKQKQNNRQAYNTADLDKARTQNHQVAMQSVRAEQQRRAQIRQQRAREQARKRQLAAARKQQQAARQRQQALADKQFRQRLAYEDAQFRAQLAESNRRMAEAQRQLEAKQRQWQAERERKARRQQEIEQLARAIGNFARAVDSYQQKKEGTNWTPTGEAGFCFDPKVCGGKRTD